MIKYLTRLIKASNKRLVSRYIIKCQYMQFGMSFTV